MKHIPVSQPSTDAGRGTCSFVVFLFSSCFSLYFLLLSLSLPSSSPWPAECLDTTQWTRGSELVLIRGPLPLISRRWPLILLHQRWLRNPSKRWGATTR